MNSIFKMSMSHCCCMSHICCSFVRIKSYFVLCVCKDIRKFNRSYQKMRENRYILHENVCTRKIIVFLTLIDTVLPPPIGIYDNKNV